jgi:diaminohydroxyphosphoribosylaminopyrimidine deaminase/5-amino-6-(5-phosphoribosylamino)uracil reductase
MERACALAERGWGRVQPNPMVGAVVVLDGQVVGEGWHEEFGAPHAEVVALAAAGERARGADLYVSLEPCAHHGKTPPCTEAILEAGVARVVYGAPDPHPRAAGGARVLRERGVQVEGPAAVDRVRSQNAAFYHGLSADRPFVALKLAMSLDGKLGRAGEETRVTGPLARAAALDLRAGYDAILVGANTARVDDPALTARGTVRPRRPPVRAVVASDAGLDPGGGLLSAGDAGGPVWVFVAEDAPPERSRSLATAGARVVAVPRAPRGLSLPAVLEAFAAGGARSVLCEGGGLLAASLLDEGLVDRLHLFFAPLTFGPEGVPAFPASTPADQAAVTGAARPARPVSSPADAAGTVPLWRVTRLRPHGPDAEVVWDRTAGAS